MRRIDARQLQPVSDAEDRVLSAVAELVDALVHLLREEASRSADARPVDLLAPAAFARRSGLSRSTLYLHLASGRIRSIKIGGRRLVPASELARLAG